MGKLQQGSDGLLQGGFTSLKGGFSPTASNANCEIGCTNVHDCGPCGTTDAQMCANSAVCFI